VAVLAVPAGAGWRRCRVTAGRLRPPAVGGAVRSRGTCLTSYIYIGLDGTGGGLFVDLRSGPLHDCVRFWDKVDADHARIAAASITDLLIAVHRAIVSSGANVGNWTPAVEDGLFDWDVFDWDVFEV
jgi:hypothetical protein